MSPRLSWSNLLPGLIALGVIVATAVSVIVFSGIGRIRGETLRLHVVANQARGLMNGSDVWLGGQRVGMVMGIEFLPPGADTTARILVVMDIKADETIQIRRNSEVRIRAGGSVIGPMVVDITAGTAASARVADGDTLRATSQSDFEDASAKLALSTDELSATMTDAKTVVGYLRDTNGTVGAVLSGSTAAQMSRVRATVAQLSARLGGAERGGASGTSLLASSRTALAHVDSIKTLLASSNTSLGRFKRDSTLGDVVGRVRDELSSLNEQMHNQTGTLGRLSADSAIVRQLTIAQREMAALFADVRRRPGRYIAF